MIATTIAASEEVAPPTVALFSEKAVGYLTFFFGGPAGFALVAYNWQLLGQTARMARCLAAALATVVLYALIWAVVEALVGDLANVFATIVNLVFVVVLRSQAGASEYYASAAGHQLTRRNAWLGAALSLGALIATIVIALPLAVVLRVLIFELMR